MLADPSAQQLQLRLEQVLAVLGRQSVAGEVARGVEPLLSLLAFYREPRYYGLLFPRACAPARLLFRQGCRAAGDQPRGPGDGRPAGGGRTGTVRSGRCENRADHLPGSQP